MIELSYQQWCALSPEEYAEKSQGYGISFKEWEAQSSEERELPYWRPPGQSMFDRAMESYD